MIYSFNQVHRGQKLHLAENYFQESQQATLSSLEIPVSPFFIMRKFQLHLKLWINNIHITISALVCPQLCPTSSRLRLIIPGSHKEIWHRRDSPLGSNNHALIAPALLSRSSTGEVKHSKKKKRMWCSPFLKRYEWQEECLRGPHQS